MEKFIAPYICKHVKTTGDVCGRHCWYEEGCGLHRKNEPMRRCPLCGNPSLSHIYNVCSSCSVNERNRNMRMRKSVLKKMLKGQQEHHERLIKKEPEPINIDPPPPLPPRESQGPPPNTQVETEHH